MRIQLDTNLKTIKLEESANLGELAEILNKLLPNNEWKNYKLETNTITNTWNNPTIIYRDRWSYNDYLPWYVPSTTYFNAVGSTAGNYNTENTFTVSSGTYNIELN